MRMFPRVSCCLIAVFVLFANARDARAQAKPSDEYRFIVDVAVGIDTSINGNVNSGAIGHLQGLATAILPNPYGKVYGTGIQLRFGAGYKLDDLNEARLIFAYQSADADLVRMGDIGISSLYGQYSDYKSIGLDFGFRRYFPTSKPEARFFGEATIGAAFIDRINILLAAPQGNLVFNQTDFYDATGAFTWSISGGVVFKVAKQADLTAQIGLRHVGGLSEVDQFAGTGLETINADSARLTFPVVVGVRFRF